MNNEDLPTMPNQRLLVDLRLTVHILSYYKSDISNDSYWLRYFFFRVSMQPYTLNTSMACHPIKNPDLFTMPNQRLRFPPIFWCRYAVWCVGVTFCTISIACMMSFVAFMCIWRSADLTVDLMLKLLQLLTLFRTTSWIFDCTWTNFLMTRGPIITLHVAIVLAQSIRGLLAYSIWPQTTTKCLGHRFASSQSVSKWPELTTLKPQTLMEPHLFK